MRVRKVRRGEKLLVRVAAGDAPLIARQPMGKGRWEGCEWAAMLLPGTPVPSWLRDYLGLRESCELVSGKTVGVAAVPVTDECSLHVASWAIPSANPVLPSIVSLAPISDSHWAELGSGKILPSPGGIDVAELLGLNSAARLATTVAPRSKRVDELLQRYEELTAAEAAAFRSALNSRG